MVEGWGLGLEFAVELLPLLLALGRVDVDVLEALLHSVRRVCIQLFIHVCTYQFSKVRIRKVHVCYTYVSTNLYVCVRVCLNFMHHIRKGWRGDKRALAQVSNAGFVTGLLAAVLQLAVARRMGREGDGEAEVRMRPRAQPALIGNLQGEIGKRVRYRGPYRYPRSPAPTPLGRTSSSVA